MQIRNITFLHERVSTTVEVEVEVIIAGAHARMNRQACQAGLVNAMLTMLCWVYELYYGIIPK